MLTKRGLATVVAANLMFSGCQLDLGGGPAPEPEPAPDPVEERCWSPPNGGSKPAPGSQVTLTARVLREDGAPAAGSVAIDDPMSLSDLFWAISTIGLTCLLDDPSGPNCGHLEVRPLDAQGRFDYSVGEEMTHGSLLIVEYYKRFELLAAAPKQANGLDGAVLEARFILPTQHVSLPDLQLWEPAVEASSEDGRFSIGFAAPPQLACMTPSEPVLQFDDAGRHPLLSQPVGPVDARLLEDFAGVVSVVLDYENGGGGPIEDLRLTSPKAAFVGTAGAPPSRGAACQIAGQRFEAGQCPLTDGQLERSTESETSVVVELPQARSASLIVVRGSAIDGARIESSLDGQSWSELFTVGSGACAVVEPPAAVSLSQVRVTPARDSRLFVSELSVW